MKMTLALPLVLFALTTMAAAPTEATATQAPEPGGGNRAGGTSPPERLPQPFW
jgi:hypothetical protein